MKLFSLVRNVIKEVFHQKIILLLIASLTVIVCLFVFTVHITMLGGNLSSVSIYGGKPFTGGEIMTMLPILAEVFITFGFMATVVLCIVSTTNVIPDLFTNGTIVFFLSKSIPRYLIVISYFIGVTFSVACIQFGFIGSFWLALQLKLVVWQFIFLAVLIPLSVSFFSMFAMIVCFGMIFKKTGPVTALALGYVLFFSKVLASRREILTSIGADSLPVRFVTDALYYLFPQIYELQQGAVSLLLYHQMQATNVITSICSSIIFLAIASMLFKKMDV